MKRKDEKSPILYIAFLRRNHLEENDSSPKQPGKKKSIGNRIFSVTSMLILLCMTVLSTIGLIAIIYPETRSLLLQLLKMM